MGKRAVEGHLVFDGGARRRQLVLASHGGKTLRENILAVFGNKLLQHMIPLSVVTVLAKKEPRNQETSSQETTDDHFQETVTKEFLHGHISIPQAGKGRSSVDRQYFFLNGRPCQMPKVC